MRFDLETRGAGAPVLFLPGSYSTQRAWEGMFRQLDGWRLLSVSLPGYGTTPEVRDPSACRMADMVGFVREVAAEIGAPFHLVGHSFGAQVALAAALDGGVPILSLVSFEGNPIYGRRDGAGFAWQAETAEMLAAFEPAVEAGNPEAPRLIIDYWSRPGTFAAMPDSMRAFCAATARTNLLDWRTAQEFTPMFSDFAALDMPVAICRGSEAAPAMRDVSDELVAAIPGSRLEVVEGADHFLISTHPEPCAAIVTDHLRRAGARTG